MTDDNDKRDAFALFAAGASVRDVAAFFEIRMALAVRWHEEWMANAAP